MLINDTFAKTPLLNDCFNLSSDFLKFRHEVDKIKNVFSKNACPQKFIDKCIQKLFNNMFIQRPKIATVPKKELRQNVTNC